MAGSPLPPPTTEPPPPPPPPRSAPCRSDKPVIKKALVEITGPAMTSYTSMRAIWAIQDWCRSPGPIQARPGRRPPASAGLPCRRATSPACQRRAPPMLAPRLGDSCLHCGAVLCRRIAGRRSPHPPSPRRPRSRLQFQGHTSDMASITLALEVNEGQPCLVNEPLEDGK